MSVSINSLYHTTAASGACRCQTFITSECKFAYSKMATLPENTVIKVVKINVNEFHPSMFHGIVVFCPEPENEPYPYNVSYFGLFDAANLEPMDPDEATTIAADPVHVTAEPVADADPVENIVPVAAAAAQPKSYISHIMRYFRCH